ncbi:PhzF family phenazine biosynthesis protein [Pseudomonas sp. HR96]|uniref:PhzF family phenazine biosynthesis protein n=1 Tax=Pseudomonas sp. HR96 TaxID=1027966 RepID=UPI002A749512|nr:PhzF family phenazine biosynthesis protein [Pseudomonas sp. HR96]WPP01266.1 PhzF family phenazine biosynthesis protein [Pseudomonas sp. HR96]
MPQVLRFEQVDVFAERACQGNALAVVLAADGLSTAQMQAFAAWTQLSETTFLLAPTLPGAHYRVRIFTPLRELPFAGHPTLGSCQVWLQHYPQCSAEEIVQECAAGAIRIRRQGSGLAFAAPPLVRSGEVDPQTLATVRQGLGLSAAQVQASAWVDNGPGWLGVLLGSRDEVLAIRPDYLALGGLNVGVIAPWPGGEADVEVRALMGEERCEDPVTGSLNASLAQWLIACGRLPTRYTASQGTLLGRRGRVQLERTGEEVWVGGQVQGVISGSVSL